MSTILIDGRSVTATIIKEQNKDTMKELEERWRQHLARGVEFIREHHLSEDAMGMLTFRLFLNHYIKRNERSTWERWGDEHFFKTMKLLYPDAAVAASSGARVAFQRELEAVDCAFDLQKQGFLDRPLLLIDKLVKKDSDKQPSQQMSQREIVKLIVKRLRKATSATQADENMRRQILEHIEADKDMSWEKMRVFLMEEVQRRVEAMRVIGDDHGLLELNFAEMSKLLSAKPSSTSSSTSSGKQKDGNHGGGGSSSNASASLTTKKKGVAESGGKKPLTDNVECHGCGRRHAMGSVCPLDKHPDRNQSSVPWKDSEKGKAFLARASHPCAFLPAKFRLDGTEWKDHVKTVASVSTKDKKKEKKDL